MKKMIISDVHGSVLWKEALRNREDEEAVIFLGDYFDYRGTGPHADSLVENFLEICDYARNNPDTHMLLGNHDWHYLPWDPIGCGGRDDRNHAVYGKALIDNLDLLNMVYVTPAIDGARPMLFSHAGVSETFMRKCGITKPEELNKLWRDNPETFNFVMRSPVTGKLSEPCGDDVYQSPLWIRPESLAEDSLQGYDQCVGHTPVREITVIEGKGGKIVLTCTLNEQMLVVDDE